MPIYEYECRACGPFAEARPMAASSLPAACPRCAAPAPRVLSPTASIGAGRPGATRGGRRRRGGGPEPSVVAVRERREPSRPRREADPLKVARPGHATDRPWMVGH